MESCADLIVIYCSHFLNSSELKTNKIEAVATLEMLYVGSFQEPLIIEGNLSNVISLTSGVVRGPWKFHLYLKEIKSLFSSIEAVYCHVL